MKSSITLFAFTLFALASVGQVFNNNYFFSPNSDPDYSDRSTLKATELVSPDEIMTVGYVREPGSNTRFDIIIVKTKSSNGAVIWANRYGLEDLDEKAFGLTLSYDKKHIIVAGTAQDKENPTDWNALAMKVEISSGNVVWSTQHGKAESYQEFRMVEQAYPGPFFPSQPTYLFVGSTSIDNQLKSALYAAAIFDFNGARQWSNIYLETNLFPKVNDLSFGMVRNNINNNFIVSGTRYEDNLPSDIFTVGINPFTGVLTDKYIRYDVDQRNHYEGAICNVSVSGFTGFGLAFTSRDPGVASGINEAITVLLLNQDRKAIRANHYWQSGHPNNLGLSIYQSTLELKTFDVYTSTIRNTNNPGFLNVDLDGPINYFLKYNRSEFSNDKYPTALVRTKLGYTAKALHLNTNENGFLLAGTQPDGKTECAEEEPINRKEREAKSEAREYKEFDFGDDKKREIEKKEVNGKWAQCDGTGGGTFKNDDIAGFESAVEFSVYPNPITSDESDLRIAYTIEESAMVDVEVYNSLGQMVFTGREMLNAGGDQLSLDASKLSSGMNMIILRSGNQVVYQSKVIKK